MQHRLLTCSCFDTNKALQKIYDYRMRFGGEENMCVGCGRFTTSCPKELDFEATLSNFADELKAARDRVTLSSQS